MIYLSQSRPSPSFFPSHLLFLFLSLLMIFLPSLNAQQIAAQLPATLTSPPPGPQNAVITYTVNARSTLVVSLIQILQNQNERFVGESSTTVNAGNNQQATIQNLKINSPLLPSGAGIAYKWRVYAVNPDAYAFSPSIAHNAATVLKDYPITITAAATTTPPTTPAPTTTTVRASTTVAPTGTTKAGQTTAPGNGATTTATTTRPASTTTTRPITTLRSTTTRPPSNGGPGDQPIPTNPPDGVVYKIISSTAVAGRWGMCAYTYQDGDTLPDIVTKLETTLGRLVQLNLDKFQQENYIPRAGDIFQYDCFKAEGSIADDDGSSDNPPPTNGQPPPTNGQPRTSSSSSNNKTWIDNNVVIFIVVLVVGVCLAAFLGIVLYKHIQAQLATDTTKRIATETKPAPPMSTPANKNWAQA